MNSEDKLKAIIEAQGDLNGELVWFERGDHRLCADFILGCKDHKSEKNQVWGTYTHVLAILLDTEGSKAAYGEVGVCKDCGEDYAELEHSCDTCDGIERYGYCSRTILDAWHSGKGNNYKEAINTAYDLL